MSTPFPHLPFLDHLRPLPGWRTDAAIISTYSAQMPVLAAVLLALAGEADETGSGSRVGLVRALTGLRGKVHVILQSGRLTPGRQDTAISALFDQFLVQVPWDETAGPMGKSWHAKYVLVRQVPIEPGQLGERWVFMLGSRNLTLDTSWDIGFSLEGGNDFGPRRGFNAQPVEGIANIAHDLAKLFPVLNRWSTLHGGLRKVSWWVPEGLKVSELRLILPDDTGRTLPSPPSGLRRLIAVSPFLDKGAVQALMRWPMGMPGGSRQLLSTRSELSRVLGGVTLAGHPEMLALAEPAFDEPSPVDGSDDDELEPERIGLHAKMIHAEHAAGSSLWLGSPNLTNRAWTRNAEAVVRVDSVDARGSDILTGGISALIERSTLIKAEDLQALTSEPTIAERLAAARNEVAARLAKARQRRLPNGVVLIECAETPGPNDPEISLLCSQIKSTLTAWKPDDLALAFPPLSAAIESDCINCRLELQGAALSWVQVVLFEPALDLEERDARVLGEYLGSRQMLTWIHTVLSGFSDGDEGGRWDAPRERGRSRSRSTVGLELPTLEQTLRMWLRDRSRLDEVDKILKLRRHAASEAEESDQRELDLFASTWDVVRAGLRWVEA